LMCVPPRPPSDRRLGRAEHGCERTPAVAGSDPSPTMIPTRTSLMLTG
jgi:hypothetical protein